MTPTITPLMRAVAAAYAAGLPIRAIQREYKAGTPFIYKAVDACGVPRRSDLPQLVARGELTRAAEVPTPPEDFEGRISRLLSDRLLDLEAGRGGDPEATARALALNVRTLATLRRVGAGSDDDTSNDAQAAAPRRTLSQLRDELLGRLQALRLEGRAGKSVSRPRPDAD